MFPLPHGMPRIIPLELGFSHSSIIYCRVHGAADGVVESWRLFVCVPMKQGLLRHYFPKEAVSRCWVVYSHEPFGALIFHLLSCIHIGDIFYTYVYNTGPSISSGVLILYQTFTVHSIWQKDENKFCIYTDTIKHLFVYFYFPFRLFPQGVSALLLYTPREKERSSAENQPFFF